QASPLNATPIIAVFSKNHKKSAAEAALSLAAKALLNRDLLRVRLGDLRQRQLQHAVDMLRLGGVRIDRFRQADRTARLAEAAFAPQRLAIGLDLLTILDGNGDIALFDLDFDLVLGDARDFGLDAVRFGGLVDVEIDAASCNAPGAVDVREERCQRAADLPRIT